MVDQYLAASLEIIRTQGIVAFLLLLQMWLNSRERAALLHKNCELNRFIMDCLRKELTESHVHSPPSQDEPSDLESGNILLGGAIIPPVGKVE